MNNHKPKRKHGGGPDLHTNVPEAFKALELCAQCLYLAFKLSNIPTRPKMFKTSQDILLLAVGLVAQKT